MKCPRRLLGRLARSTSDFDQTFLVSLKDDPEVIDPEL
jgi:hypothetical protein